MSASAAPPPRPGPIEALIGFSLANRAVVLLLGLGLVLWGLYATARLPIDAIPDLSENQVIVFTDWPGRSAQEVEDQVTYPLSVNLQGLAGIKAVRATSEFGWSLITLVFEDGVDPYFARERVLERLSAAPTLLPAGVLPYLAPDANALGQIYWYTLEGSGQDLGTLRALQDWYVRYQLQAVPGVAEVASAGGFVREYQVDVDPTRLRAFGVSLGEVFRALSRANGAVGGSVLNKGRAEYLVRGEGWIRGVEDVESALVAERDGVPVFVRHLGRVQVGPAPRRAVLERDGAEAVGGVVVMRQGENPLEVTRRVEERIATLQAGLPPGVRIVPFYTRAPLIHAAIDTLTHTLLEEMLVASLMVLVVLRHLRSSLVICATLPLAVLGAFLLLHLTRAWTGVGANIMSLSGIAISIGVLVDAGIVMTENAYTRLHQEAGGAPVRGDTRATVLVACQTVGRPLFFSILIMLVSFLPVFALGGLEGRLFWPLALTKTFALIAVALLAVTVVPALIPTFVRGRLSAERDSWLVRSVEDVYRPVLSFLLDRPRWVALAFAALLGLGLNLWPRLGREFMPPLDEGSIMDMPVTVPNVSTSEAAAALLRRDALLRGLPEAELVVGKAGRAETPTDPAPVDMVETVIGLRPRALWPRRAVEPEAVLAAARALLASAPGAGSGADAGSGAGADAEGLAMDAQVELDRALAALCRTRQEEAAPGLGRALVRALLDELVRPHAPQGSPGLTARLDAVEAALAPAWGPRLARGVLAWDVADLAREAAARLAGDPALPWPDEPERARAELLRARAPALEPLAAPVRALLALPRPTLEAALSGRLSARRHELLAAQARALDLELEAAAPEAVLAALRVAAAARGLDPHAPGARGALGAPAPPALTLRQKTKPELVQELDQRVRVPGWANIWTQPIVNRVDMLATGVRTELAVKVYGPDLAQIQAFADRVAEALRRVPGAVDVFPDQVVGESYVEVRVDRERAARYGVAVEDVHDTIEVALGGKRITTTIEGRQRFAVRVRYPRDLRRDEEQVRRLLVAGSPVAGGGDAPGPRPLQVPLAELAEVRVVRGPSMIKSENGLLRAYVQLNVRGRDVVGFVEEARPVVEQLPRPPGTFLEWSGQFEHQVRARHTLTLVVPLVVLLIFVILWLTYRDLGDALLMMLAVPGALVGGVALQWLLGLNFSVAVWVGMIACFGLATETGIIMLVYLREAIERRGGLAAIGSLEELRAAVVEGAVQRLRPKLLTEGTTILGLVPMLAAEGVGAEIMRPMAAPVLGGILVADEVIDVFIPVIFLWVRRRRWERLRRGKAAASEDRGGAASEDRGEEVRAAAPPPAPAGGASSPPSGA